MLRRMSLIQTREKLKVIFSAGVNAAKPHKIIQNKVKIDGNNLIIEDRIYVLREKIYMVGFGKGVMGMAIAMEKLLGDRLVKGIISVPRGTKSRIWDDNPAEVFPKLTGVISYEENSYNNYPDSDTLETTQNIIDMVEGLSENDTLIVLITGGGSALLSMPLPTISIDDKLNLCKKLFDSGANINEVNRVRQKLSVVKAGGLARIAYPASVIGLILSDIIGDPINLIASGPTVYNPELSGSVSKILEKYNIFETIDEKLKTILVATETNKTELLHVENIIIGNNSLAIDAARLETLRMRLNPIVLFNDVQGTVSDVSAMYAKLCHLICQVLMNSLSKKDFFSSFHEDPCLLILFDKLENIFETLKSTGGQGLVLIAGGEPSVVVKGSGKGGRNQELALRFALDWYKIVENHSELNKFNVVFLSAGTDGQDGPTDATGAFGSHEIISHVFDMYQTVIAQYENNNFKNDDPVIMEKLKHMTPEGVLENNNSYSFYSKYKQSADLLKTGLTGTNVMDLHLIYIKNFECSCQCKIHSNPNLDEEPNFFADILKGFQLEKNVENTSRNKFFD